MIKVRGRERPVGMENFIETERNVLLPIDAFVSGFQLYELTPKSDGVDPFILYNRWGDIVYRWPDDYAPSFSEVAEIFNALSV